jgi:hypothetical protein
VKLRVYCPYCTENVASVAILPGGAGLDRALENDADVEITHITLTKPDHRWRLNREEKARLKKWRAESAMAAF